LLLAILYNVGPATAVAFMLWFSLQRRIEANVLSLIVLIVPLVGIAAGWLQLGERPSGADAIGMALILVRDRRHGAEPTPPRSRADRRAGG